MKWWTSRADRIERMFMRMADMYDELQRENASLRENLVRLQQENQRLRDMHLATLGRRR